MRVSFAQVISEANRRAHEEARIQTLGGKKKIIWASVAATQMNDVCEEIEPVAWLLRVVRWFLGAILLPVCWVTCWTLLSRFSVATVDQDFWKTAEFWYFATGVIFITGWLLSGLFQSFFLYIYVLGHELTHAIFVLLHLGKVTDFHVSAEGGYITTNKTNLLIALSPYFIPFWSIISVSLFMGLREVVDLSPLWNRGLYGLVGITWAFHMLWTVWMIPRDQPDLQENGTFLSLVVIFLANLIVLAGLLCLSSQSPLQSAQEFGREWMYYASIGRDVCWQWGNDTIEKLQELSQVLSHRIFPS